MPAPADYIDVSARIVEFREKYPDGCLRPADPAVPYRIEDVNGKLFLSVVAAAYRTPDDPTPGIGMAWEPLPGPTNFTRDSELQNAETSAWGRALIAVGAADARRGVASANEVNNRQAQPTRADLDAVCDRWSIVDVDGLLAAYSGDVPRAVRALANRETAARAAEKFGGDA